MNEFEARLHRTWLGLLLEANYREVAALVVDADLEIVHNSYSDLYITLSLPTSAYFIVTNDRQIQETITNTLHSICNGHLLNGNDEIFYNPEIKYLIKLLDVEENWRDIAKDLISNAKDVNQGSISERAFTRRQKDLLIYNEMKFASNSEVRIAQELENHGVLFFPLPLAVRNDTGYLYTDHREVDFLVCQDGTWGILEVSYHPDRFEKDAEKDAWFKQSGILCIQHYSAERCYNQSEAVVNEFLTILARYKR